MMTPLLKTKDLAQFLSVSPCTIKKMVREGTIPYLRVGRQLRFDRAAVMEALSKEATADRGSAKASGAT